MSLVFWGRSVVGCQKVLWKVSPRFRQGCASFVISLVLWGRSVLGCQKVLRKIPPRFHHGSTKVPPRFFKFRGVSGSLGRIRGRFHPPRLHRGFTKVPPRLRKFRGVSGFLGQIRFCGKFPHHFFKLASQLLNSFFVFFPTALTLKGSSAIAKVLGKNDTFVFLGSLQQMVFASQKVLWSVPQTILHIGLTVSCNFLGKWLLLQKRRKGSVQGSANYSLHLFPKWPLLHKNSLEGSANCALHLSPSLLQGPKLRELLTCLTDTYTVRRKRPIMSLLLASSLALFTNFLHFYFVSVGSWFSRVKTDRIFGPVCSIFATTSRMI